MQSIRISLIRRFALTMALLGITWFTQAKPTSSVLAYDSIQAAIDANPGRTIYVPPGDYPLDQTLLISTDHTSLMGPGRLIQNNPNSSIIRVDGARHVRVAGLTLTRPANNPETTQEGITVRDSRWVELDGLHVIDNRGPAGSIRVMDTEHCTVRDCLVLNYMFVTVEDRTGSDLYGFAFKAIDGTGIVIVNSPGIMLVNNRVAEENLAPTPEQRKLYDLGRIVKRNPQKGSEVSDALWNSDYVASNWHQGSGIYVGRSSGQLIGNHVLNAAQGLDIHSDHVIVANNRIENAHMGMKAMHGSRNVLITGNQFHKPSLWGICLSSGTSSHPARPARADAPAREANLDGGTIIANNIISDFGYGSAWWNWKDHRTRTPILIAWNNPQVKLTRVVVHGNLVYDPGPDGVLVDNDIRREPPRYRYAVMIEGEDPEGLHFADNLLPPGSEGVSNRPLPGQVTE